MAEELKKQDQLAKASEMQRPSFIPVDDTTGTEHITQDDIQMPRIALAQGLTPQVMEAKEGFQVGLMFNNITEEILGRGPLRFSILRADPPRWIEFNPRDQGGGVKDMDVPAHDSRTRFWVDENGKKQKPLADKFYDFIIALHPLDPSDPFARVIALSFKGTGLKIARQLNGLIKIKHAPIYAGVYDLRSEVTKNAQGTFAIFNVKNAGFMTDQGTYELLNVMADQIRDKDVKISREGAEHDLADEPAGDEPQESNLGGRGDVGM